MSYPINYPTPQSSNFQEFYGGGTTRDWVKPQGASMVRMLLIGAGAGGRVGTVSVNGAGGGSGAVTQWIGPAMFIPDVLRISIGAGGASASAGGNTTVIYQAKDGTGYTLLTANGGASQTAGTASSNNYFGAAGIFKSVAGQAGAAGGTTLTAPSNTFLTGGAGGRGDLNCNYGYPRINEGGSGTPGKVGGSGFFITQPIMMGVGGAGGGFGVSSAGGNGGNGGIGCGGGGGAQGDTAGGTGGRGGDGAVFIWSW